MAAELQTDKGKAACRKSERIAESLNGGTRNVPEFGRFSMRGLARCDAAPKLVSKILIYEKSNPRW